MWALCLTRQPSIMPVCAHRGITSFAFQLRAFLVFSSQPVETRLQLLLVVNIGASLLFQRTKLFWERTLLCERKLLESSVGGNSLWENHCWDLTLSRIFFKEVEAAKSLCSKAVCRSAWLSLTQFSLSWAYSWRNFSNEKTRAKSESRYRTKRSTKSETTVSKRGWFYLYSSLCQDTTAATIH